MLSLKDRWVLNEQEEESIHQDGRNDFSYVKYNNTHNISGSAFCNYSLVPSIGKINLTTVPSFEDLSIQIVPP
jgi:hypothetical protein